MLRNAQKLSTRERAYLVYDVQTGRGYDQRQGGGLDDDDDDDVFIV